MEKVTRKIPEPIKRMVRQKCYFGCIICGCPVFTYDHFEDFALVYEHTIENINLLCPNHHTAKTTGKLSKDRILEASQIPFNKLREKSSSFNIEKSRTVEVLVGGTKIHKDFTGGVDDFAVLMVRCFCFLGLESDENWISIYLNLTDENGNILLTCDNGELQVNTGVYDFIYEGTTLIIRRKKGVILCEISLSNYKIHIKKGYFLNENKVGFIVENGTTKFMYNGIAKNTFTDGEMSFPKGFYGQAAFRIGKCV